MKTEFKGTKGIWVISDQDSNGIFIQNEIGNGAIARVYDSNGAVFDLELDEQEDCSESCEPF